jgi:peptidoglycan/LPS O-acetylase OafA/YrhL
MARIYSVALPALLLTLVADHIGENIQPAVYTDQTTHDWGLLRFVTSVLFMNEFWGISITAFSNVPYWSLSYEVWYYVLFGLFVFWKAAGRRWVLAVALLMAGAKILLLFPIWLLGVYLWRSESWKKLDVASGIALWVLSWILLVLFHQFGVNAFLSNELKNVVGPAFHTRLAFSKNFLGDYLLGAIVFLNFAGFRAGGTVLGKLFSPATKPIRWLASFTLSIYLFHRPLLLFYTALIDGDPQGLGFYFAVVGMTIVTSFGLGLVTEHQKDRYRQVFSRMLSGLEQFVRKHFPKLLPQS